MGAQISQVQPSQGNQPVNPSPTTANYSPVQQQYGGGKGAPQVQSTGGKGVLGRMDSYIQGQQAQTGYSGRKVMYSPLSDQPSMGAPNPYPNTIGQWDNASIQPQPRLGGKGKGI